MHIFDDGSLRDIASLLMCSGAKRKLEWVSFIARRGSDRSSLVMSHGYMLLRFVKDREDSMVAHISCLSML